MDLLDSITKTKTRKTILTSKARIKIILLIFTLSKLMSHKLHFDSQTRYIATENAFNAVKKSKPVKKVTKQDIKDFRKWLCLLEIILFVKWLAILLATP